MNNQNSTSTVTTSEALQARAALRITALLDDGVRQLPHDVTERLRFAREKAIERAHAAVPAFAVPAAVPNGSSTMAVASSRGSDGRPRGWWLGFASVLPLAALVGGLVLIQRFHVSSQVSAAAEVDAALLADELPPTAYSDPGFVEFLKTARY